VDNRKHFDTIRAVHPCATRCAKGTYAMVYFPQAEQSLRVDLSCLLGRVKAWWYDPRNGNFHAMGEYPNEIVTFTSPISGPDWVLVLDDIALSIPLPALPPSSGR